MTGETMRVVADREVCVGAGQCVRAEPGVFDQDEDDGLVRLLVTDADGARAEAVREAVDLCPSGALSIEEGPLTPCGGNDSSRTEHERTSGASLST